VKLHSAEEVHSGAAGSGAGAAGATGAGAVIGSEAGDAGSPGSAPQARASTASARTETLFIAETVSQLDRFARAVAAACYTAGVRLASIVPAQEVLAGRNIGSWASLAFGAGFVNAAAFLACQRFVTHITGILTHAGVDEGRWTLFAEYLGVLFCFVVGAMTAVVILDGRRLRGLRAWPWLPLCTVAAVLTGCAVAGEVGLFGAFGTEVESRGDFVLLWVLAYAMGLQNASVANATGSLVRTTHMTGPATDLGVALAFLLLRGTGPDTLYAARRTAILRASKMLAFILGAVAAAQIAPYLHFLSFLVPAGICLVVALRVFGKKAETDILVGRNSLVDE
jgi:uncharacterized membrane protein YoaK (UPF0700 family)